MKNKNSSVLSNKTAEWDKVISIAIFAIVIFIPVAFYPYCMPAFNPAKEALLKILTLLALALFLLKAVYEGNRFYWQKTSLEIPVLLFVLLGSLSLIWTVNIYNNVLALPLFLAGPILYFISSNYLKDSKMLEKLFFLIIIVGAVMSVYGVVQYFGIDFKLLAGRIGRQKVGGLFGNVNYFAEYLILPLSLTIGLFIAKNKTYNRFLLFGVLLVMGMALFFTFTRGSYLAIAVAIPVMLLLYFKSAGDDENKRFYKKIILGFLLLIIIVLALIYIPHPLNRDDTTLGKLRNRLTIETLTSGSSTLRRIAIWKFTWMMIEDCPLAGSGLGTYVYNSLKYQAEFFSIGNNRDIYPHGFAAQAHNEYLQFWSELGTIGLLLFLWIIFTYYRNILKVIRDMRGREKAVTIGLAGGVTAVLVDAFFGFPLQLSGSYSLFWLFIGITSAQINIVKNNADNGKQENVPDINKATGNEYAAVNPEGKLDLVRKGILSFLIIMVTIIMALLLIRPFVSRVYWYYGNKEISQGNYNEGIKIYEKALKWNPWQGEMYYDIGIVLANKNINNLSLEYFHKAEKYIDHHILPHNIAIRYLKLGDIKTAIPYLEKAIKYQQDKESMLPLQFELGNIYSLQKEFSNAERMFSEIIRYNPDNVEAYYKLAGIYISQDKKEQAIKALEKVIEIAPESKEAGYAKTTLTKLEQEK